MSAFMFLMLSLSLVKCFEKIYVDTPSTSKALDVFSKSLFDIWKPSDLPVDLSQLNNFKHKNCLISISNYINSPILNVNQPFFIWHPVPAVFQYKNAYYLRWIFESSLVSSDNFSSSLIFKELSDCYELHDCAMTNYTRVILHSRLWNCHIRIDLFPPYLDPSWLNHRFEELLYVYQYVEIWRFGLPYLWDIDASMQHTIGKVMPGRLPILHFLIIPMKYWENVNTNAVLSEWTDTTEYNILSCASNIQHFLVDIIDSTHKGFFPGSIQYIDKNRRNLATLTNVAVVDPDAIHNFLVTHFLRSQSRWHVEAMVSIFETHFQNCKVNLKPTSTAWPAAHLLSQAVVQVWQSILKNHTYKSGLVKCSNGKGINLDGNMGMGMDSGMNSPEQFHSIITIDDIYLRRYLHIPLMILNPTNGSFQFVVCGMKDWEGVAYGELINVYDKFIWGSLVATVGCVAFVWILMTIGQFQPFTKNHANLSHKNSFFSKTYSLLKILLEQGDFDYDSTSIHCHKVRLFLAIFLLMSIILSNGYKNANMYNMIAPRKPLRYEHFNDLVAANFSIYGSSKAYLHNWWRLRSVNWFLENITMGESFDDDAFYSYFTGSPKMQLITVSTMMGNPSYEKWLDVPTPHLGSQKEINFNKMVQAKAGRYRVNILKDWIDSLKTKFKTWENLLNYFGNGYDFIRDFALSKFAKLEGESLLPLLLDCNKTALVVRSNEAKAFARLLTRAKGNPGKEVYFQNYFLVKISGLVTPIFLTRLARIKESGIMEWWSNMTEYISLVQFHTSANRGGATQENHPSGASIRGNITVIFSLLLVGLFLAAFGFILEALLDKIIYVRNAVNDIL